jgi:hypothetical protein
MPCRPWEDEQLDPAPEHPVTPTKPTRNDGASHAYPDAEGRKTESDREEDLVVKKIRQPRHVLKYVVVKRWVTGERAKMDEDQIRSELEAEMRHLIDNVEPGMTVKKALAIYMKWHVMHLQPTWGAVPFSCSCKVCFAHCICRDTIPLASGGAGAS